MAANQQHIIDRLQVEVSVPDPNQAHEVQEKVSGVLRQQLEPMIEKLFDQVPKDKTIVIDRLELDLGLFSEAELDHAFLEELQVEIEQELSELIRPDLLSDDGVQKYSKDELYYETLSKYLQTGTYPWFVSQHHEDDALRSPNMLFQTLFSEQDENLLHLIKEHSKSTHFRNRLLYLLDDAQFRELTNQLESSARSHEFSSVRDIFNRLKVGQGRIDASLKKVRLALLSGVTSSNEILNVFLETFSEEGVIEQLLKKMAGALDKITSLDSGELADPLKEIAALYRLQQQLDKGFKSTDQLKYVLREIPPIGDAQNYLERILDLEPHSDSLHEIKNEINRKIDQKIDLDRVKITTGVSSQQEKQKEEFYVTNAGLILLWPFLPRFFRKLELTAERQFVDRQSRFRAINILQYLVTGERSTFEHVMVFNKVLCGYSVERPFPSDITFSENELQEADALLESAIEQWEALKSTSVEGFRQSFLQRNARLEELPKQWELQVESKGFDVLLDKLPWGISVARLPWMNNPIYVNWR